MKKLLGTIGFIAFVIIPYLYASEYQFQFESKELNEFQRVVAEADQQQHELMRRGK